MKQIFLHIPDEMVYFIDVSRLHESQLRSLVNVITVLAHKRVVLEHGANRIHLYQAQGGEAKRLFDNFLQETRGTPKKTSWSPGFRCLMGIFLGAISIFTGGGIVWLILH